MLRIAIIVVALTLAFIMPSFAAECGNGLDKFEFCPSEQDGDLRPNNGDEEKEITDDADTRAVDEEQKEKDEPTRSVPEDGPWN